MCEISILKVVLYIIAIIISLMPFSNTGLDDSLTLAMVMDNIVHAMYEFVFMEGRLNLINKT